MLFLIHLKNATRYLFKHKNQSTASGLCLLNKVYLFKHQTGDRMHQLSRFFSFVFPSPNLSIYIRSSKQEKNQKHRLSRKSDVRRGKRQGRAHPHPSPDHHILGALCPTLSSPSQHHAQGSSCPSNPFSSYHPPLLYSTPRHGNKSPQRDFKGREGEKVQMPRLAFLSEKIRNRRAACSDFY